MGKKYQDDDEEVKAVAQPELLDAFADTFTDCDQEYYADRVFDYASLRQYFGAFVLPKQPDPLPPYIEAMREMGFVFRTTYDGQPAVFAKLKNKRERNCPALFTDEDNERELEMLNGPMPVQLPDQVNVLDVRSDKDFVMFPKDLEPLRELDREIME